jgi:cytochrome b involved in lipid metabolism
MTVFHRKHPGGPDVITELAGQDATERFENASHTKENKIEMEQYYVGEYQAPRIFTKLEQIADHNQPNDLWLLINNKVYDVSGFKHPGKNFLILLIIHRWQRDPCIECRYGCYHTV